MHIKLFVIFLILFSLLPESISWYQSANSGGLNWPMLWLNEKVFWGLVFIGFSVAGVLVAYKNKAKHPRLLAVSLVLSVMAMIPAVYDFEQHGLGPSSKMDGEDLNLFAFWVSDWWK